ncbi:MAG: diaminopimelate epimerase [Phycisphaerae bacterium]|nr:diaminopimelate epimerase [Phycisphaerae bacterium]NUQ44588.1 diaminopimelate epimerase [Phycisphaerae bacterium]
MSLLRFVKMHGLGNDYVYVDGHAQSLDGFDRPRLAREISDRHRGVGGDGLILILPPSPGVDADVRMEMYNADGSRGEMCGNGIRCVARYAVEQGLVRRRDGEGAADRRSSPARAAKPSPLPTEMNAAMAMLGETLGVREIGNVDLRIETDRGVLDLVAFTADGVVRSVRVNMGPPILEPGRIPVAMDADRCIRQSIRVEQLEFNVTCVSMGNPHAVVFVDDVRAFDLAKWGPLFEHHKLFPRRINLHVAQRLSRGEARMRTWERGTGMTQACGTGACAVLVAGVLENRLDRTALLHLPGGELRIEWPAEDAPVFMTGPAEECFRGEWHGRR